MASNDFADDMESVLRTRDKAISALLSCQNEEGWWKGELETNVSVESQDLFMREFMGIRTDKITQATANWIRSKMRDDGTWSNFYRGPAELSTTTEAYVALRMAGDSSDASHMKSIREFILNSGGLESTRNFTRIWMSLFGEWDYKDFPTLRPEMMFMPKWFSLNIYNFASWARQTLVPLLIIGALRPVRRTLPFTLDELRTGQVPKEQQFQNLFSRQGILQRMDRTANSASRWLMPKFIERAAIKKAIDGFDSYTVWEGNMRRLECSQSPIWDTALAVVGLVDAGVVPDHEALQRAGQWLLTKENNCQGDWSIKRPKLTPGGWAFEYNNVNYPDMDDTAEVVLALDRLDGHIPDDVTNPIKKGVKWVEGMQCRNGGYASFDVDNDKEALRDLPFCDFGAVIDPPTEDVTAHVIEMFVRLRSKSKYEIDQARLGKAVKWLKQQQPNGSWFGRWGCNYIYGAGAVLPALIDAGVAIDDVCITATVEWLVSVQNKDNGWGEDMRSYEDKNWAGKGESTASQTAWAVIALLAAGDIKHATDGIKWLVQNQQPDGTWDELFYTGTGFPGEFYINYHLYRDVFPLTALGRYISCLEH